MPEPPQYSVHKQGTGERWSSGPSFRPGDSGGRTEAPVKTTSKKPEPPQYSVYKTKQKTQTRPASYRPPPPASPVSQPSPVASKPPGGSFKSSNPGGSVKSPPQQPVRHKRNDVETWPPPGLQYAVWTGDNFEMRPPPGPGYEEMRGISPRRKRSNVKIVKCVDLTDTSVSSYPPMPCMRY
eukprot:TRINITY_DN73362_c0_g1_i1.p1 TRINITY_DN73362_c0_g1~~TRINITY_DN73362_c0_g1_i1.p1  ORF type:complete len:181 (+),score=40.23 TRINITY_DN73362_c0_g1_i1:54-596(+)